MKRSMFVFGTALSLFAAAPALAAVKGSASHSTSTPATQSPATSPKAPVKGPASSVPSVGNASKGTPTWEIQEIEKRMEAYNTAKNLTAEQKENNVRIKREILSGAFDLTELSRLALDKNWNQISAAEQSNFVTLMTNLLETKAIFSKEKTTGKAYTVKFQGDKYLEGQAKARTFTQIYVPKENLTLAIEYRLKKAGDRWKVYDVIVDDASLVENYRYQFNAIISKHGYPELVKRMNTKLTELKNG